jgi:hypothetical protein
MPTTGVIVDINLKTNIDTNQIGSPSWVQFLVYYLISYCWLQVDDKCLNTNWYIYVGASWAQILISIPIFHKKFTSPKFENPKTAD